MTQDFSILRIFEIAFNKERLQIFGPVSIKGYFKDFILALKMKNKTFYLKR